MVTWKGFGRKWSWPNVETLSHILLEGLRKIMKNFSEDSPSLGRDLDLPNTKQEY
jgi:hypothetical protein